MAACPRGVVFPTLLKLGPKPCPSLAGCLRQGVLVHLSGGEELWCHDDGHDLPVWKKGKSPLEGQIYAREEQESRRENWRGVMLKYYERF